MRKTVLLSCAALFIIFSAQSQITKGSIFLGGDLSASTQKIKMETQITSDRTIRSLSFSPVFGKAVKENLVLGGSLGILLGKDKEESSGDYSRVNGYSAGVFLRQYRNIGKSGFYLFIQGGLNGIYNDSKGESISVGTVSRTKRTTVGINAYPGLSYAVSRKLHLETGFANLLSLGYFNERTKVNSPGQPENRITSDGFSLSSSLNNANSSLYLGFRVLLSK